MESGGHHITGCVKPRVVGEEKQHIKLVAGELVGLLHRVKRGGIAPFEMLKERKQFGCLGHSTSLHKRFKMKPFEYGLF